jgi:hypothetical protein
MELIWAKREAFYFWAEDWTDSIGLIGFEKFGDWRKRELALNTPQFLTTATPRAHLARSA